MKYPRHENGGQDKRYTANLEFMGYSYPLHAVRFCGDLIGACRDESNAERVMMQHQKDRLAVLCGESKT